MSLIKSISGIRGTIGGVRGSNLTPIDIVTCTAGYGEWIRRQKKGSKVIVGRDGRISGSIVSHLVINTLLMQGLDVIDAGLTTTPTVEMAVPKENAAGGIILTASHNPREWNALKLLNHAGEFLSAKSGQQVLEYADEQLEFATVDELGTLEQRDFLRYHLDRIINHPWVNKVAIQELGLEVVVDCINSTGAISIPPLLDLLGIRYTLINDRVNGEFSHNPEPLEKNLGDLIAAVKNSPAQLGIAVDPDVDRLVFVCEDGSMFGEEYTLVACADHALSRKSGPTVSNLSSTMALADVTRKHGGTYHASAVGEVNVVEKMKEVDAVVGGEGNGGVIIPDLHYGRDALAGIAIFLSLIAERKLTPGALKASYPVYAMSKQRIELAGKIDPDALLSKMADKYKDARPLLIDGVKIHFEKSWVHMRKSNTEPIIRIYTEAADTEQAESLATRFVNELNALK